MLPNRPLSETWYESAQTWVDAESAASALEDTKSAVFSQMVVRSTEKSVARAEIAVRSSDEWQEHLSKIGRARTHANRCKIAMEYQKMRFMEANSKEATDRVAARL